MDDGLLIDLRRMKDFSLDKFSNVATMSPGLTLGEVYYQLWNAKNLTVGGGNVPFVGLGKYLLVVVFVYLWGHYFSRILGKIYC